MKNEEKKEYSKDFFNDLNGNIEEYFIKLKEKEYGNINKEFFQCLFEESFKRLHKENFERLIEECFKTLKQKENKNIIEENEKILKVVCDRLSELGFNTSYEINLNENNATFYISCKDFSTIATINLNKKHNVEDLFFDIKCLISRVNKQRFEENDKVFKNVKDIIDSAGFNVKYEYFESSNMRFYSFTLGDHLIFLTYETEKKYTKEILLYNIKRFLESNYDFSIRFEKIRDALICVIDEELDAYLQNRISTCFSKLKELDKMIEKEKKCDPCFIDFQKNDFVKILTKKNKTMEISTEMIEFLIEEHLDLISRFARKE